MIKAATTDQTATIAAILDAYARATDVAYAFEITGGQIRVYGTAGIEVMSALVEDDGVSFDFPMMSKAESIERGSKMDGEEISRMFAGADLFLSLTRVQPR